MKYLYKIYLLYSICILAYFTSNAQLNIKAESNAQALVQKLLGQGLTVSNIKLTSSPEMTGIFNNIGGTNISIDSGIVLTNGRAKTIGVGSFGVDGDGNTAAISVNAYNILGAPGDNDLSAIVGDVTHDACVLEFDFVPLGDTIKFNYLFSSEEYTHFSCSPFNDAFAFFISGPGILGLKNIALIPGTNLPVTINNINPFSCALFPQYYVDNSQNKFFTHDGHLKVLTAIERVQPCQTYHLKLVIADVHDYDLDSGVFLEAKSLSSNAIQINNNTQTDNNGNSYLVEGCSIGSFQIKRPELSPLPLVVTLSYSGTATNGVDVQMLPLSVTIPANDTAVTVNVIPIIDLIPEGIETIKIYALSGCPNSNPTDSAIIQIRDYDTLGITPPDTSYLCKGTSIQLTASAGYNIYQWDANPTLNNTVINNPIAIPVNTQTTYYCSATQGTCNARDSVMIQLRKLYLKSSKGIICKNDATGEIKVSSGPGWVAPFLFSINNGAYQTDSSFLNLPSASYIIKIKDASGCIDSLNVTVPQLFPDLVISSLTITPASCSGNADGSAAINVSGGNGPYQYSTNGTSFQSSNIFNLINGNYTITVKDNNNCSATKNIIIPLNNTVTLVAGADTNICEGKIYQLNPNSNGKTFLWSPTGTLSNPDILNPFASPVTTTKYYITAKDGICSRTDSITILVNPAPVANAGKDATTCYQSDLQLNGSGGTNYLWSPTTYLNNPAIANPVVTAPVSSVIYSLKVADANGCNSLKDDSIAITVTAPEVLYAGNDTSIAIGQPLQLFAVDVNNTGFNTYTWSPPHGLDNPFSSNPVAVLDRDITYYVSAANSFGCKGFDTVKIKAYRGPELYVPNSFTPNGDGLNDVLKVIAIGMKEFHFFSVYNRYGQLIFTTSDSGKGWDGRLKGKLQNMGTYVWMTEALDYKGNLIKRKGTVVIIQ